MAFVSGFFGGKVAATAPAVCSMKMTLTGTNTSITVVSGGNQKEVSGSTTVDLRKNLVENGVDVYTLGGKLRNCGGNGACGLCRVRVLDGFGNMDGRTPREDAVLRKQGAPGDIRLACRTTITGPVTVETKPQI